MNSVPDLVLPDRDYPFIDQRYPLSELAMIEVPESLQRLLIGQSEKNGTDIVRDTPVELRCVSEQFGDASFLILAPRLCNAHARTISIPQGQRVTLCCD